MVAIRYPGRYCLPNKIIGLPDVAVNNKPSHCLNCLLGKNYQA
mgnify:FL=1